MYPLLMKFLLEKDVLSQFISNRIKGNENNSLPSIIINYNGAHTIDAAFLWQDTKQGYAFWKKLHEEYRELYKKTKNVRTPISFPLKKGHINSVSNK